MMNYQSPISIVDTKLEYKKKLNRFRNAIMVKLYVALIENVKPKEFAKELMEIPKQKGLSQTLTTPLLTLGINLYKHLQRNNYFFDDDGVVFASRSSPLSDSLILFGLGMFDKKRQDEIAQARLEAIADNIFSVLEDKQIDTYFNKTIYETLNEYEKDSKQDYINELKKRTKESERVFYLCSAHGDCAKDHEDYQGRYYVDENWRSIIKDKELKEKIENYIKLNNIKTFEYIIGSPVWLITRPHCRHYFRLIDTNTVLSGRAITIVLRDYKLWKKEGERGDRLQSLPHATGKWWYREENVREIIERYSERLDLHEKMYKEYKSPYLYSAIRKDKLLVNKWKAYLKDNFIA